MEEDNRELDICGVAEKGGTYVSKLFQRQTFVVNQDIGKEGAERNGQKAHLGEQYMKIVQVYQHLRDNQRDPPSTK